MATKIETLEALVHLATSKQGGNDAFCDLDFVAPAVAARIERLTNLDVRGFRHTVGESAIRHVLNRHSDQKMELTRGQVAITVEDFLLLPQVFADPDEIFVGDDQNVVQLCKRLNNDLLVLQEIRTGRKKLALLSMWKRPLSAPVAPHLSASTAEASAGGNPQPRSESRREDFK
jgi:phage-Barnase-EndoU-ColicinE5/D-RelE like nuclease3